MPSGYLKAVGLLLLLAAPWHAFQLAVHPRWFWTDYVQVQLLGFGLHPPAQPVPESALHFYGKRLLWTDPPLSILALISIPFLIRAVRKRKIEAVLLLCWLMVACAALLAFQYHNLPYLLLAIPPLSLVAANYGPLTSANRGKVLAIALAGLFCVRAMAGAQPWRIAYGADAPIPAARSMEWYASQARSNELIAVDPDDEFYSAVVPLPKVRYCFLDPSGITFRYAPHYGYLGITVTVDQFNHLETWEPQFREHLREWGLDSTEPVATAIVAASAADVGSMIAAHPQSDFYLPGSMKNAVLEQFGKTHRVVPMANGRFFALALDSVRISVRPFVLEPAR